MGREGALNSAAGARFRYWREPLPCPFSRFGSVSKLARRSYQWSAGLTVFGHRDSLFDLSSRCDSPTSMIPCNGLAIF